MPFCNAHDTSDAMSIAHHEFTVAELYETHRPLLSETGAQTRAWREAGYSPAVAPRETSSGQ